ncbi:uncharacterized protein LOC104886990 [Beta vulgaris subsp. vulgaris]|uniref:uncharacterized protein LOC104886990 n=1 Tax=Beta vulgaris subsp. vulgaris TaxID=3555 RepID=UPI00053FCEEC|nr:uncharacterized protein LOC104886990 [Beta vulgaris subsp. vulgaris]
MVQNPFAVVRKFLTFSLQMTVYSLPELPLKCSIIIDIVNHYELAPGHKINYEKSEVSLSSGVSIKRREELITILNMRQVDKHEKYLAIPSISGRSKKVVFDSLLDRILKKLQGWKEKFQGRKCL